ncbi:DUF4190 domain-containing protein [Arthrobacter mobilis]|uniref:DUF4190 domain-containing protein n=1 Tax=Arthrobacter mobilis TaxID=2724944 RepID=A0A7X6HFB6_9MICC|nr:DUF4190 domain-containing protein [Arthrobacter mobilis]NKX56006.1 DUF4190 domain-containing protein [Arthrobacter mobilis]
MTLTPDSGATATVDEAVSTEKTTPAQGAHMPRYAAGLALVLAAYCVSGLGSFISYRLGGESLKTFAATITVLIPLLAAAGFIILPARPLNRMGAVAAAAAAWLGGYFIPSALRQVDDLDTAMLLGKLWGAVFTTLIVAAWLIARTRSRTSLAVVLPAAAVLSFILMFVIAAIPADVYMYFPAAFFLRLGLLGALAWAAWAIDNRGQLQGVFQTSAPTAGRHSAASVPAMPVQAGTNGLAIAAFVMSLVLPVIGLILGYMASGQLKREGGQGAGLAQAAIIISWIFIGLWAVGLLIFVMAGIAASS